MHIRIGLGTKYPLKLTILRFLTKFFEKECFWSKTEKGNTTIEFLVFKLLINLCTKFKLNLTILMFLTKFAKIGCFPSKTEKVNTTIEFGISESILVLNSSRNWECWLSLFKFAQHGVSHLKQEHWTVPLNSAYSNYSWDQVFG